MYGIYGALDVVVKYKPHLVLGVFQESKEGSPIAVEFTALKTDP